MHTTRFIRSIAGLAVGLLALQGCNSADQPLAPDEVYPAGSTEALLETIRRKHNLPSLAAAVVQEDRVVRIAAVGIRKVGSPEKVSTNDKYHIGSIGKSITSAVAAKLVEEGKIAWTTTVEQALPELTGKMHPNYRSVTLEQLLSHSGGAPDDQDIAKVFAFVGHRASGRVERLALAEYILSRPPQVEPGTQYLYSNLGYTIAGLMMEQRTQTDWEVLVRKTILNPLGLSSAGFGAPATPGNIDQPWGHFDDGLRVIAVEPSSPNSDNRRVLAPIGTLHLSLPDLANYARFQLQTARGYTGFFSAKSIAKLYAPHFQIGADANVKASYALGWVVLEYEGGRRELWHNGANGSFLTHLRIRPQDDLAVVATTNIYPSDGRAAKALEEAIAALIER